MHATLTLYPTEKWRSVAQAEVVNGAVCPTVRRPSVLLLSGSFNSPSKPLKSVVSVGPPLLNPLAIGTDRNCRARVTGVVHAGTLDMPCESLRHHRGRREPATAFPQFVDLPSPRQVSLRVRPRLGDIRLITHGAEHSEAATILTHLPDRLEQSADY